MATGVKATTLRADRNSPHRRASRRLTRSHMQAQERRTGWLFTSPALLGLTVFVIGPSLAAVWISLTDYSLLPSREGTRFVGLGNYVDALRDGVARSALWHTAVFSVGSAVSQVVVALALALAVHSLRSRLAIYVSRVALFLPFVMSWAAAAVMWSAILDPSLGFVNYYLGLVGLHPPNWWASPAWAMPAIMAVNLWFSVGFGFLVLLAGLQTVPRDLMEAAMIDGASAWRRLVSVTLPMLSPTMFFLLVVTLIGSFQIFEPIFIITGGGPGRATETLVPYIYEAGFREQHMGYAAALSIILLLVILLVTAIQFLLGRKWVHYEAR